MDEATELAKALSSSFSQGMVFLLLPQHHGSIDAATVVSHRRILEDKIMARLSKKPSSPDVSCHVCQLAFLSDLF